MMSPVEAVLSELRENTRQWEAYEEDDHCVVLAGPGSGKTKVLTAKVARLLVEKAEGPRGVACITYNNECARELKTRIDRLGIKPGGRLFVGTVHSFCLACIDAPFGHLYRADLKGPLRVATVSQSRGLLAQAIEDTRIGGQLDMWIQPVEKYRRTHPQKDASWHEDALLAGLIDRYEALLRQGGLIDFDGLVLTALDLIRTEPLVRASLEARFPYLVIDEYQDLGYPLHLIVRTLMETTAIKVFAVGDPDQSIYGFTGADPRYLRELAADGAVHQIQLEMNYRCAQRIIDGSQVALAPTEPRGYRSARETPEGELVFVECSEGLEQQAQTICTEIIPRLNSEGIPNGEIAILYIDRQDAGVLSDALQAAGIKFAGERDQRYLRTPFTRWLEGLAAWRCSYPHTDAAPQLDELLGYLVDLKVEAGLSLDTSELNERVAFFEVLRNLPDGRFPLGDWLAALDEALGIRTCLELCPLREEDLDNWGLIRGQCEPAGTLAEFRLDDFARGRGRADTVTLTTLHSSKGLEYQIVIMPGLEDGRLPNFNATSEDAISEARRVFYVGMTRAKDAVYLLYSGWYQNRFGRIFSPGASRFVIELQTKFASGGGS